MKHFCKIHKCGGGFTLPEVTIAVAVCFFGLVGVLALLPHGLRSARSTLDHTIAARIAEDEIAWLRAMANSPAASAWPPANWVSRPGPAGWSGGTHYFDYEGNKCSPQDPNCYFQVRVLQTARVAAVHGQIRDVTIWIRWPYRSAGGRTGLETRAIVSNCFVTSIARYDRP
ncbi:MAG: hypothetical protein N3B01_07775 [Verrucomicrobiae bacterium]|nr:hypothetical protein [Verrucomicrobiae bacterium]